MFTNVPAPLPDECLRSYGYRVFEENKRPIKMTRNLLQDLHRASRLSIDHLVRHHTHLGYFRFVSEKYFDQEISRHPDLHTNRMINAGLTPSRTANYCPKCIEEDCDFHGLSYWRRSHQLPGVNHCSKHSVSLYMVDPECLIRCQPSQTKKFSGRRHAIPLSERDIYFNSKLIQRFTTLSETALDQTTSIKQDNITAVFHARYKQISTGDFNIFTSDSLENLPTSWRLHLSKRTTSYDAMLGSLVRLINSAQAPYRTQQYLLIMAMLWENPDEALNECISKLNCNEDSYCSSAAKDALEDVLRGASITSACRKHGVLIKDFDRALQNFLRHRNDLTNMMAS
ncbi:TniQ family protein [Limnohabitans sp. T6-20]|uniref:TniQ family protein n=1 Tax=Limnohabitans sp. T6-20 TaxID=1100725 RepID=UPI000D393EE4|nr:TniQ family protein [Limnohabitans sp. T6-20]PUE12779.1 hypothetical protein B9Z33_04575 [Limnohabitans sp. T6-20]